MALTKQHKWLERLGFTLDDLAKTSGYSKQTLYWFFRGSAPPRTCPEFGKTYKKHPIREAEWTRFRNICAGVEYQLKNGKRFDW